MDLDTDSLDQHYDAYHRGFPHFSENHLVHAAYGARIARCIGEQRLRSVLSLGIGHTEVANGILRQMSGGPLERYVIVDGSPRIIEAFKAKVTPMPRGLEVIEGLFENFACAETFDAIEAGFVLEHVDDPASLLRRIRPFLNSGGRLFVAVPNARSLHRQLGHQAGMLSDMYALSPADLALGHKRYFDVSMIEALVSNAGYTIRKTGGMLLKPFTTAQMEALDLPASVWRALVEIADDHPDLANAIYLEAFV